MAAQQTTLKLDFEELKLDVAARIDKRLAEVEQAADRLFENQKTVREQIAAATSTSSGSTCCAGDDGDDGV